MAWGLRCLLADLGGILEKHMGKKSVSGEKLCDARAFRIAEGANYSVLSF